MGEWSIERWTAFICAVVCAFIGIVNAVNGEVVPGIIFGLIFRWRASLFYKSK